MTLVQDVFHSCISKWDSKNKLMPNVILLVQYSIINTSRRRAKQRILQIAQKNCMLCRTQSCCCRLPTKLLKTLFICSQTPESIKTPTKHQDSAITGVENRGVYF